MLISHTFFWACPPVGGSGFRHSLFYCPAGQLKRAQTMPLSLTRVQFKLEIYTSIFSITRVRDASENPFTKRSGVKDYIRQLADLWRCLFAPARPIPLTISLKN